MKDTLSQNSHDRFMNFIANDDWRPNGGFPITYFAKPVADVVGAVVEQVVLSYYFSVLWLQIVEPEIGSDLTPSMNAPFPALGSITTSSSAISD
jgi:hypothetical protein